MRYVLSLDNRSKLTVFTIAIVIMFVTSTLVIVYSFELSNQSLVNRFESKYFIIASDSNLLDSKVYASVPNATAVWLALAKINNVSTFIFAIYDPQHLFGYGYECKDGEIVLGNDLHFKNTADVKFDDINITLDISGNKDMKFFPNYWAAVNRTLFGTNPPNFLIVEKQTEIGGYKILPMTVLTEFYAKTAEDVTFDLVLIDMITIIVVYLFINALLNAEIIDSIKKISIMRAIGSSRWNIGGIFLLRALYIGTLGMITGFSFGVILAYFLAAVIPLTGMLTYFIIYIPHIVFVVDILIATLGSLLAAILPVRKAINVNILAGIRGVMR